MGPFDLFSPCFTHPCAKKPTLVLPPKHPRMHIYLIGFMGSGKSYTGKHLADYLGRPFIDLDDVIEAQSGMPITSLFKTSGETHFRVLEATALRDTAKLPTDHVIACGGGTPCFHDNMNWMKTKGLTIFLDIDEATLLHRLEKAAANRPILHGLQSIADTVRQKMTERRPYYEQAHIHFQPEHPNGDLARLIADQLPQIIGH